MDWRANDGWVRRYGPYVVVGVAVAFGALLLWPETFAVDRFSDEPAHVSWVAWAADRIAAGHSPLDGWYPNLALGAPQFHQYEVLAHIVGGAFVALTGIDAAAFVRWSMYLLVVSWPISVYLGARLLDRDRNTAAVAALLAPLVASTVGFGLEWSSYTYVGPGLWAQAVAAWIFPLAIGLIWRAIDRGYGFAPAAATVAVLLSAHFFWGYVALVWLGVVVLAGGRRFVPRVRRGALVAVGGVLASAWLVVPLVTDFRWIGYTEIRIGDHFDSYGARRVLEWLFTGELLDAGRPWLPLVSVLALVGVGVCVTRARRDAFSRVLLIFTGLTIVMFFGRPTLGGAVDLVPGLAEIPLHRFLGPLQFAALILAGIGGVATVHAVDRLIRTRTLASRRYAALASLCALIGVLLLGPAVVERHDFADFDKRAIEYQQDYEGNDSAAFAELTALATRRGGGRIFAGNSKGGGIGYRVGQVPSFEQILIDGGSGIGYWGRVASLSVDTELAFDPDRIEQYPLFGVRYLILPSVGAPTVPATRIATRQPYSLYEVLPADGVTASGYLRVVDSVGPAIKANRKTLGDASSGFVGSTLAESAATHPIAFDGEPAAEPTTSVARRHDTQPGTVQREREHLDDGRVSGRVTANRRAIVVLAASYHRRWAATVDGKPVETQIVAPSFVAVEVPEGTHDVNFTYEPYPGTNYALLFAVGIGALGALVVIDRRQRAALTR